MIKRLLLSESPSVRLKIFAFGIAAFMAVIPTILYGFLEMQYIHDESRQYSQFLGERLEQAIAENPQLWQYAAPKLVEIDRYRQWFPDIAAVFIEDQYGRRVFGEETQAVEAFLETATEYGFSYKSEPQGVIRIKNRLDRVAAKTMLVFLLCSVLGIAAGRVIREYSMRQIRQANRAKRQTRFQFTRMRDCTEDMTSRDFATGAFTISHVSKLLWHLFDEPAEPFSILLADIDLFRRYNERNGYELGNRVLFELAGVLRKNLREKDILGRFGGEEFIILLPETSQEQAMPVAERLRAAVQAYSFPGAELQPGGALTISIGVTSSENARTIRESFRQLDATIYQAKRAGRNEICAFSTESNEKKISNFGNYSPAMKAEVTRKFIDRFLGNKPPEYLAEVHEPAITAFLKALEIWDPDTLRHSLRVNRLAMTIARAMDLPASDRLTLDIGTLLHDIGKLTMGDSVLIKPGKLSNTEYELMKTHSRVGYDMVKDYPTLQKVADIVLLHHERFDGAGYPEGLEGKRIPLLARICTVADSLDAMMTERPYSKGKSVDEAREELLRNKGRQFDPEIVDVVLSLDRQVISVPSPEGSFMKLAQLG